MHWSLLSFCLVAVVCGAPQVRRQVITPTWLMGPSLPNSKAAPKVQVTQQNLREVAALRAQIQKAVDEGTYVVAAPPPQVSKPSFKFFYLIFIIVWSSFRAERVTKTKPTNCQGQKSRFKGYKKG